MLKNNVTYVILDINFLKNKIFHILVNFVFFIINITNL